MRLVVVLRLVNFTGRYAMSNGSSNGASAELHYVKRGKENVPVMRLNGDGSVSAVFVIEGRTSYKTKEELEDIKELLATYHPESTTALVDEILDTLCSVQERWSYLVDHEAEMSM
jgi:hypothetical protein